MKRFLATINIIVMMFVAVYADRGSVSVENEYKQFLSGHHIIMLSKKHHRSYVKVKSNFLKDEKYPGMPYYAKRVMIEFVDEDDITEDSVINENNKLDLTIVPEIKVFEIKGDLSNNSNYINESFLFNNTNQQRK